MLDIGGSANGASLSPQVEFDSTGAGVAVFIQNSGFSSMPSVLASRFE
jgi:hypothetical protein